MTPQEMIFDINERISELTKERDEFVRNAERQVAAMAGGLQELESMLAWFMKKLEVKRDSASTQLGEPGVSDGDVAER